MDGDSIGWQCPLCQYTRSRMVKCGGTAEWRRDSYVGHLYDVHNIAPVDRKEPTVSVTIKLDLDGGTFATLHTRDLPSAIEIATTMLRVLAFTEYPQAYYCAIDDGVDAFEMTWRQPEKKG